MSDDLVEVTQADKEAAKDAWEKAALADLYCDPRNTGPDFGPEPRDPEGVLAEAFARHRLASQPVPASSDLVERVAAMLLGSVNAPEQEIYRVARAIIPIIQADEREANAKVGYRICAETRHVTLGDKVATAIRERNGSD